MTHQLQPTTRPWWDWRRYTDRQLVVLGATVGITLGIGVAVTADPLEFSRGPTGGFVAPPTATPYRQVPPVGPEPYRPTTAAESADPDPSGPTPGHAARRRVSAPTPAATVVPTVIETPAAGPEPTAEPTSSPGPSPSPEPSADPSPTPQGDGEHNGRGDQDSQQGGDHSAESDDNQGKATGPQDPTQGVTVHVPSLTVG